MILAIDLSLTSTGYAKFSSKGEFIEKGQIVPEKKLHPTFKINRITKRLTELMDEADEVVIEDLFFGKNFAGIRELARLSGAVINSWVTKKKKLPHLYMASTARKLIGLAGNCQKIEVQLYVSDRFNFCSSEIINTYQDEIESAKTLMLAEVSVLDNLQTAIKKTLTSKSKSKYKRVLKKLSTKFEKETGVGNDFSDAIVLALAFLEDNK